MSEYVDLSFSGLNPVHAVENWGQSLQNWGESGYKGMSGPDSKKIINTKADAVAVAEKKQQDIAKAAQDAQTEEENKRIARASLLSLGTAGFGTATNTARSFLTTM
jgi:hypothetical protein